MDLSVYARRRVLITGGLGFIGSNLAHRLVELGAEVTVIDALIPGSGGCLFNVADIQERVRIHLQDIRDQAAMGELVGGQEALFHLAGQVSHLDSMRDPYTDLEINCRGSLSLLEACRQHNPDVRIVFAGTRQIYGRPRCLPVDESHPPAPTDVNGVNKLAAEGYHLVYHQAYGLHTTILRMTNTYGPRMRVQDSRQTFIGWWLRQIVEGQELAIFGDGRQVRDFNFVDDVVEALLQAAVNPVADGQIYNLGSDEAISLSDLAALLVEINGGGSYRRIPFPDDRRRIDIGDYQGNYDRIRADLGWEPRVSLREGLERTIAYYRTYRQHYW